ncbi:hypothetical protein JCM1841_007021 [Sporobolomyces salmonicolor]
MSYTSSSRYSVPHPLASLSAAATAAAASPEYASSAPGPSACIPAHAAAQYASSATYTHRVVQSPESVGSPTGVKVEGGSSAKKRKVETQNGHGNGNGNGAGMDGVGDREGKKRQVVSCSECKRRKIKCDRKMPCLACCKRGDPGACRWGDEAANPKPDTQPFALSTDLVRLAERLQALERWAHQLPPELRASAPVPQGFEVTPYVSKVKASTKERERERMGFAQGEGRYGTASPRSVSMHDERSETHDDRNGHGLGDQTEDAAVKLVTVAFSQRLPDSRYRPVDSLPFFENILSSSSSAQVPHGTGRSSGPADHTELTSALTSIVATPLTYEGPFSGSAIGLGLVSSLEELRSAWRRELEAVYRSLPDRELSSRLVNRYFDEVDWLHNVCYKELFLAEHERQWEMRDAGRGDEVDPMWLACYCMILALSVDGLRCQPHDDGRLVEEQDQYNPVQWYACTLRLMQLGDFMGRPQVRFIQAIILIGQWLQFSAAGGQASRCLSLLASAIRAAQILGLHQLSNDPSHMPPPDPAWPPGANSIKREGALRLFGLLAFLDYMSATTRFRSYLLDPNQCTTPPTSNVNFDQLSPTDWRVEPLPRNVFTDSSFEWAKHRIAQASREVFDKLVLDSSTFSYDTILELDRKFRAVLADVEMALPFDGANTPARQWKLYVCLEGIHSRIVRLHRPFMMKTKYSRECCLESAEMVVKNHLKIIKWTNNIWFTYSHTLGAATALFADLFDAIDHDLPEREIEKKKEVLVLAFEIFGRHDDIASPQLRHVVQTGSKILSGLFLAEEKRRVSRAASALVGGKSGKDSSAESFAAVLQRLTEELDLARPPPLLSPVSTPSQALDPVHFSAGHRAVNGHSSDSLAPHLLPPPSNDLLPSVFDQPGPPSLGNPFDLTFLSAGSTVPGSGGVPGTAAGGASLSTEFWKDGLGFGSQGGPMAFDFWSGPPGTVVPGYESGEGGAFGAWPMADGSAGGTGAAGGAGGAESNRMAANALLDQLASSGW